MSLLLQRRKIRHSANAFLASDSLWRLTQARDERGSGRSFWMANKDVSQHLLRQRTTFIRHDGEAIERYRSIYSALPEDRQECSRSCAY